MPPATDPQVDPLLADHTRGDVALALFLIGLGGVGAVWTNDDGVRVFCIIGAWAGILNVAAAALPTTFRAWWTSGKPMPRVVVPLYLLTVLTVAVALIVATYIAAGTEGVAP